VVSIIAFNLVSVFVVLKSIVVVRIFTVDLIFVFDGLKNFSGEHSYIQFSFGVYWCPINHGGKYS
jgi:hypothetical protein